MSDELPQGWTTVSVGDAATRVVVGYVGPCRQHYAANGIPFLMGKNVRASRLLLDDLERVTAEFHAREKKSQLAPNDVIVVRIGRSGTAVVVPENLGPANCGGLIIVKNPTAVMPSYLAHYLNSPKGQKASWDEARGVTRQTLNTRSVEAATIPLAPLAEQRRIVVKLETLLSKVDASQQRLAKIPVLLKRFRQSVLAAACSGRLTADWRDGQPAALPISIRSSLTEEISTPDLPETWLVAALDDCCSRIIDGNYGADYPKKDEFVPSGIPFLTSAAIGEDGNITETEIRFIAPSKHAVLKKAQTTLGDVVFTNRGARVGATAMLLDSRFAVSNIGPQVTRLASNPAVLLPKYLFLWMRTSFFTSTMKERNGGSAMNFLNLTVTKALPIFLPPLPEQQEIVRRVEGLFALADPLERLAKARGQVDALTPSLLARAFAGQLVPQDPTDEPAEKLLERIKTNHESKCCGDSR